MQPLSVFLVLNDRDGGQKNSIGISFVQTSSPGSAGFPKPQPSRARRDCFATPSQGVATSYFLGHALSLDSYLPPLPLPAESPSPDPKQVPPACHHASSHIFILKPSGIERRHSPAPSQFSLSSSLLVSINRKSRNKPMTSCS